MAAPHSIPKVIAHRGAAQYAPENTLVSIHEAALRGASMVEIDVRLTADGEPIIFHDDTLDRTTNGTGPTDAILLDEIRRLDAGAWFGADFAGEQVPTLAEVIGLTGLLGLDLNIEIKSVPDRSEETARVALEVAREVWPADRAPPFISSFQFDALQVAHAQAPDWPRGLLLWDPDFDWRAGAEQIDATTINVPQQKQTAESVAAYVSYGKPVLSFTVNAPDRAKELFGWGVHAVFSDLPDLVSSV